MIKILYPSYISYKANCDLEFRENKTYIISGIFYDGNITICEEEGTKEYRRALLHEETHLRQQQEGRLYNCSKPIGVYINEVEAYLSEYILF